MTLTQDDRISISKKIVAIPKEIADANAIKGILDQTKAKAQAADNANKNLSDNYTALINQYQDEIKNYDGNVRNQLTEQMFLDSANHKQGNFFAPNQPTVPTPGLPSGIWTFFPPYSKNVAIGKLYSETYTITNKESDLVLIINNYIATLESYTNILRSTGQSCGSSGVCDLPAYTTQITCEGALPIPGVWTPGPDLISNDPAMQALSVNLITAVSNWQTFYLNTQTIINAVVDSNSTRNSKNIIASGQITTTNNSISSWQSLPTFDTAHGTTNCPDFNSYNVALLQETKYRADGLAILKSAITQRNSDISNRLSDLNTNYLGLIVQSTDGTIATATGLYGSRFRICDLRLNLMSGTLPAVLAIEAGKNAQDQSITSNNSGLLAYADILIASQFTAPSIGINSLHIKDASGFAVNDLVYIIADGQPEIMATITEITGNFVKFNNTIPAKYLDTSFGRIYKVL